MINPPFLVIRPGKAFWVETRPPHDATATLRAFADGCYSGTWWYDSTGGVWTVVEATLKKRASLLDRGLQRPVAVELRFGPRAEGDLAEALARIREVTPQRQRILRRLQDTSGRNLGSVRECAHNRGSGRDREPSQVSCAYPRRLARTMTMCFA